MSSELGSKYLYGSSVNGDFLFQERPRRIAEEDQLNSEEQKLLFDFKRQHKLRYTPTYIASFEGAFCNFLNASFDYTILTIPFVLRETGLIVGVSLLLLATLLSLITVSYLRAGMCF